MYSILGPSPGGSAGTSFCSGAEISMKRRTICPLCPCPRAIQPRSSPRAAQRASFVLEPRDFFGDRSKQSGKALANRSPHLLLGHVVVVVPVDVSDAHDRTPRKVRMFGVELPREAAGRLGDDLQRSRYGIKRPPVTFELLISQSGDRIRKRARYFPEYRIAPDEPC